MLYSIWFAHLKNFSFFLKRVFILFCFSLVFIILISKPNIYSIGINAGFSFCIQVLIPSLFPFIFLSSFMVKSGISALLGKLFSPITKILFYLPGCSAPAIILGLTGGYPSGAKYVKSLLDEKLINKEQANRMMCFNVGAGPAFIISAVGEILFKNKQIGIIIFSSEISFALLLGVFLGFCARISKKDFYEYKIQKCSTSSPKSFSCTLNEACNDSVNSTINMCSPVILFYAFIYIINSFHPEQLLSSIVPTNINILFIPLLLEVNSCCSLIAREFFSPTLAAFAIGWGGLCVHLQISSVLEAKKDFNFLHFLLFRIIQGLGAASLVYFITSKIDFSTPAIHQFNSDFVTPALSTTFPGSFALILVCIYFINNTLQFKSQPKFPANS